MLVSAHNGGVDHHVFVVVIARQLLENALENPALRPPAESLINDFPIAETLGQIAPRNPGSISVENGFDELSVIPLIFTEEIGFRTLFIDPTAVGSVPLSTQCCM